MMAADRGTARTLRFVVGKPVSVAGLVMAMADAARRHSMGIVMEPSRCTVSVSNYLHVTTAAGFRWTIRVSNHDRPRNTGRPNPHIEILSYDGVSGRDACIAIIDRIASGDLDWFDAGTAPVAKGKHQGKPKAKPFFRRKR